MRKLLSSKGLRYRLNKSDLPGKPDIVFVNARIAIFIDGDFWHGRHWQKRKREGQFKVRRKFWIDKIETNIKRDRRINRRLKAMKWKVFRIWATDVDTFGPVLCKKVARLIRNSC